MATQTTKITEDDGKMPNGSREILIDPEFVVRDSTGVARET